MKAVHLRKTIMLCALIFFPLSSLAIGPKRPAAHDIDLEAAGSLDPGFGNGGKVLTDFGGRADEAFGVAIQSDRRIVVAGRTTGTAPNDTTFALARYNADGGLDLSFGSGGKVTTSFPQGLSEAWTLAIQQDGKIVVAGDLGVSSSHAVFAVARYNTNGALDPGFGAGGLTTVDFGSGFHTANAIAIESDGKIVLAGSVTAPSFASSQFGVARLNADGTLDSGFGNGGMATGSANSTFAGAYGVSIQPDGKIVAAGYAGPNRNALQMSLVRYLGSGALDAGFGTGGSVSTGFFGLGDQARDAYPLADGRLLVVGTATVAQSHFNVALARYNPDGRLDTSFGTAGKLATEFPGGSASGSRAVLQPDGKIIVAGLFSPSGKTAVQSALARYDADGTLDQGFGTGGLISTDVNGIFDPARAVALQADGNIVVAGDSQKTADGYSQDFLVLRYLGGSASFSLALSQSSVTGDRGTKVKITISINRIPGFTGNVTVTPPDSAQGVRFKPPDPIATTDPSVAFKLKIAASAPTGPQQLTFTGKSDDGQASTATVTLNIQ